MGPLLQLTRTVPIVFVAAADRVGAGYVESLARPGGNATGFSNFEFGMGAKWLELLTRCRRYRARGRNVRAATQWWADCDGKHPGTGSSRSDHRAGQSRDDLGLACYGRSGKGNGCEAPTRGGSAPR